LAGGVQAMSKKGKGRGIFKMRKEKGITLIALMVTLAVIIVLLGVSINVFVNSDIIGHSEKTGQAYTNALENDKTIGNDGVTINGKRYANMEDFGRGEELIESNIPGGTKVDENKEYTIEGETRTAVIPGGFTISGKHSERTIEGGLVIYLIYDKTEDEIEKIDWNDEVTLKHLKETYDQFVWVPVTNVNKMFMCQSKTAETECNIELVNGIPTCTNHSNSTAMAGRLYATSSGTNLNSSLTTQTYKANDGLREPAIITGKADGTGTKYDGNNTDNNIGLTLTTLQEEYNNAVKKVIESKGFWIGRYETSGMNSSNDDIAVNIVAEKGENDGINNLNWYRMYKQQQNYVGKKNLDTSKIQSTMIFGAAWDKTMIFANCATETTPEKDYSTVITGNVEKDCYKNIYDLCGNLYEWTTEAVYTFSRVSRGRRLRQQLFC
jgi:type II secretory pathway pseudopilin PulG